MTRNTAGGRKHWALISHFVLAGLIVLFLKTPIYRRCTAA